jgi:thiol-disulfide isomerase/thioredoxin
VIEREVEARGGAILLTKVDVDANPRLAEEYGIRSIPAVKAFKDGRVVREFVGAQSPQSVAVFLDALLAPSESRQLLDELVQSGEFPQILGRSPRGDCERALSGARGDGGADEAGRERIRGSWSPCSRSSARSIAERELSPSAASALY